MRSLLGEVVNIFSGTAHDGRSKLQEVRNIAHLFGEEICWIEGSRDVNRSHFIVANGLPDGAWTDVELTHVAGNGLRVHPGH